MPSSQESDQAVLQRRPNLGRHASASTLPQSSFTGHPGSYKSGASKAQKHVVGKLGRNISFGKELNKHAAPAESRNHKRTPSGGASAPGSPAARPAMKRNISNVQVKRNVSHTALRKNLSSGHLPRQGSAKNLARAHLAPSMKRAHSHGNTKTTSQAGSPRSPKSPHPTVRFDMGDDEEDQEEEVWTEESVSQSPETTRANTRHNAMLSADPEQTTSDAQIQRPAHARQPSDPQVRFQAPESPPASAQRHSISDSSPSIPSPNKEVENSGSNGMQLLQPKHPMADAITAKLLQRSPSYGAAPQTSNISATVHSDLHNHMLGQSQGSTLNETPGKDLVSRFINGSASSGNTPLDASFLVSRQNAVEQGHESRDTAAALRKNKSTPNMAQHRAAAMSPHNRSTSNNQNNNSLTSAFTPTNPELHPSRTQQKLWLQRASSTIEPQNMMPAILPRSAFGRPLVTSTVNFSTDGGRLDPRVQSRFDQVNSEYKAIRRYRNPLAEAIHKLGAADPLRREWIRTRGDKRDVSPAHSQPSGARTPVRSGASTGAHNSARVSGSTTPARTSAPGEHEHVEIASRNSRVSFNVTEHREHADVPPGEGDESEDEGRHGRHNHHQQQQRSRPGSASPASQRVRPRKDAYDVCLRLWDSVSGDDV